MPEDAPSRRIRHANHHPRSRRPQITTSLGRSPPIDNCITAAPRRTLYQRLVAMTATGRIVKSADGYHLAPP